MIIRIDTDGLHGDDHNRSKAIITIKFKGRLREGNTNAPRVDVAVDWQSSFDLDECAAFTLPAPLRTGMDNTNPGTMNSSSFWTFTPLN